MLDVINRISNHEPQPFIAPVPTHDTTRVLTVQENIPYWFDVRFSGTGWHYLQPRPHKRSSSYVRAKRTASFIERLQYLEQLPRFHVIALFPTEVAWVVMPFNISDASQRQWYQGTPMLMYLLEGNIQELQVVHARRLGKILLYDAPAQIRLIEKAKETEIARSIIDNRIKEIQREIEEQERAKKLQTFEGRIEESLQQSGAALVDWELDTSGKYKVEWTFGEHGYTTIIDNKLRVLSAGVCLDGTDNWHSLNSIVHVMEDRRKEYE